MMIEANPSETANMAVSSEASRAASYVDANSLRLGEPVQKDRVYTAQQLSEACGHSVEWLRRNVLTQGCPHVRLGRLVQISGGDYLRWIESRASANGVQAEPRSP